MTQANATGPIVVLVHAACTDASSWNKVMPTPGAQNYDVNVDILPVI